MKKNKDGEILRILMMLLIGVSTAISSLIVILIIGMLVLSLLI